MEWYHVLVAIVPLVGLNRHVEYISVKKTVLLRPSGVETGILV